MKFLIILLFSCQFLFSFFSFWVGGVVIGVGGGGGLIPVFDLGGTVL